MYPEWLSKNIKPGMKNINFFSDCIEIAGLKVLRENLKAPANGTDVWEEGGDSYFTFQAARRESANRGLRAPSDEQWQILEDAMPGESNGERFGNLLRLLGLPLAGYCNGGSCDRRGVRAYYWSSPESGGSAWYRSFNYANATVYRGTYTQSYAFSVRCLKD